MIINEVENGLEKFKKLKKEKEKLIKLFVDSKVWEKEWKKENEFLKIYYFLFKNLVSSTIKSEIILTEINNDNKLTIMPIGLGIIRYGVNSSPINWSRDLITLFKSDRIREFMLLNIKKIRREEINKFLDIIEDMIVMEEYKVETKIDYPIQRFEKGKIIKNSVSKIGIDEEGRVIINEKSYDIDDIECFITLEQIYDELINIFKIIQQQVMATIKNNNNVLKRLQDAFRGQMVLRAI